MLPAERRQKILVQLRQARFASVEELARHVRVSEATVRRDLEELGRQGLVSRTRGGAELAVRAAPEDMPEWRRRVQHVEEKRRIGQAAAKLVEDGDVIFIEGGTTTLEVARALDRSKNVTVITDSIEVAWEVKDRENLTVILTGGILSRETLRLFGPTTYQALKELRARKLFLGVSGFSLEHGLCKLDLSSVPSVLAMMAACDEVIVVADSSKIGKTLLMSVAPVEAATTLVTDAGLDPAAGRALHERGIKVVLA